MNYTIKDRNEALISVENGNPDLSDTSLFEGLESFNWVYLKKVDGAITHIELTYSAKALLSRLHKKNI